jgi:serine/threonine protein kinase
MLDSGSSLTIGQIVPDYELLRRIGGGAYGEVWLARSKATGVLRAAKIVWRHTFDDERPFQREFEGIQRFERISREHPRQLSLFHIGRNDAEGYFYYVMELADDVGTAAEYAPRTLRADLNNGRLPAERVLEIGLVLAEALGHLHKNALVHRDVKPSNVIFVNGRPKLADIGLVTDASDTRSIVGTEGYLPPEGPGTPQADIFALGKVLYEAMTGLDRREYPRLPESVREWPDRNQVIDINEIVLGACAPEVARRYQSCEELQTDLALLHQGKAPRRRRAKGHRLPLSWKLGAALAVAVVVAVNFAFWERQSGASSQSVDGPPSTNMEANALCDKALLILRGDNYRDFGTAYTNFHRAIELDHNFARPYAGLLEFRLREDVYVPGLPDKTEEIRTIARRLTDVAPHFAATYCAQSIVNWADWDFQEALRNVQKAIKTTPKYELDHAWYSWMLVCLGRPDRSRDELEIARELAPSKTIIYRALGNAEVGARHYTNAINWYKIAINWEPNHFIPYRCIGECYMAMGDYTNALPYSKEYELRDGGDAATVSNEYALLRHALDTGGIRGYWEQQWKWTEPLTNSEYYWKGVIQMHLGNTDEAFRWLETSYDRREDRGEINASLTGLFYDLCWDGVHDDRRFKALVDKVGLSKVTIPERD